MSVADRLGLGPTRIVSAREGSYIVSVTPPAWVGGETKIVRLDTPEKIAGYRAWENGVLIQDALPMLTPDEREILMNGGVL